MIRINLLSHSRKHAKDKNKSGLTIILSFFFILILPLIYYYFSFNGKVSFLNDRIESARTKINKLTTINNEILGTKEKLESFHKRINRLQHLEYTRYNPVRLLSKMTDTVIYQRMCLESLFLANNVVDIKGIAMDENTVVEFISRLEEDDFIRAVNLKSIKKRLDEKKMMFKDFEITCYLRQ